MFHTPWTLPANMGIALSPEVKYVLTSDNFIVAAPLYETLKSEEVVKGEIVREIDPKELEGLKAVNPLNNRSSVILLGEHVQWMVGLVAFIQLRVMVKRTIEFG
jgi:isoleucyl-tRNA synthetase